MRIELQEPDFVCENKFQNVHIRHVLFYFSSDLALLPSRITTLKILFPPPHSRVYCLKDMYYTFNLSLSNRFISSGSWTLSWGLILCSLTVGVDVLYPTITWHLTSSATWLNHHLSEEKRRCVPRVRGSGVRKSVISQAVIGAADTSRELPVLSQNIILILLSTSWHNIGF